MLFINLLIFEVREFIKGCQMSRLCLFFCMDTGVLCARATFFFFNALFSHVSYRMAKQPWSRFL
jgi:hypothetical protein